MQPNQKFQIKNFNTNIPKTRKVKTLPRVKENNGNNLSSIEPRFYSSVMNQVFITVRKSRFWVFWVGEISVGKKKRVGYGREGE